MKSLSEEKKAEVRCLHKKGYKHRQIASIAGISAGSVSYILQARSPEQNKTCNIPKSLWDEWDILHERYGKRGTHRAKNRLRTGRKKNESYCKCKGI